MFGLRMGTGVSAGLRANLDAAANVATICVAAVLSVVLVKTYLLPAPSPRRPQAQEGAHAQAGVGTSLNGRLPGVDWSRNGRTVVLAISTQCHFCKDSAPFYRKLRKELGSTIKTVAVLPQPVGDAEQFLKGEGVQVDQVKQAAMESIGVRATPTMLLVNRGGIVIREWVGKVQPEQEQQVLAALGKG